MSKKQHPSAAFGFVAFGRGVRIPALRPEFIECVMKRKIRTILECAAGPALESWAMIPKAERVILVEPVPELLEMWTSRWDQLCPDTAIRAHQVAITREAGDVSFSVRPQIQRGARKGMGQSFLTEGPARPAEAANRFMAARDKWPQITVPGVPLSEVDDGEIDVAIFDMEGAEWNAISTMVSRPSLLMVERVHNNQYSDEIDEWLKENEYVIAARQRTNFIYIR